MNLVALAQEYGAELADADGFDLEGEALRISVARAIRRKLGGYVRIAASLGPLESCPNVYRGELRAALFACEVCERDLDQVVKMLASEAA